MMVRAYKGQCDTLAEEMKKMDKLRTDEAVKLNKNRKRL